MSISLDSVTKGMLASGSTKEGGVVTGLTVVLQCPPLPPPRLNFLGPPYQENH